MDAKSLITRPSGGDTLPGAGFYELTGIAWTGPRHDRPRRRHHRRRRDLEARDLQTPVLPIAHTRFRWPWQWDGRRRSSHRRCTDDTGYVQPTLAGVSSAVRGVNSNYHNNAIQAWKVASDGTITNGNRA